MMGGAILSIFIGAALLVSRVVLTESLQWIRFLLLVLGMAGGGAQLLHLIPRRRTLPANWILRAQLLSILDTLNHLIRYAFRRCSHRPDPHATGPGPGCPLPGIVQPRWLDGLSLWWVCSPGQNSRGWETHTGNGCHSCCSCFSWQYWRYDNASFKRYKRVLWSFRNTHSLSCENHSLASTSLPNCRYYWKNHMFPSLFFYDAWIRYIVPKCHGSTSRY